MPEIQVVFYQEDDGKVPVLEWILALTSKARIKHLARIKRLQQRGHALRRPEVDYLRDGIYELRVTFQGVNHRILYFFHGQTAAVLSHGLVKERQIPPKEIDRAIERKKNFERNPENHTYIAELE